MSEFNYDAIEERFARLLQDVAVSFTATETKEVADFIEVGEYGLALQTLVDIVVEEGKRISPSALLLIEELVSIMGIAGEVDLEIVRQSID